MAAEESGQRRRVPFGVDQIVLRILEGVAVFSGYVLLDYIVGQILLVATLAYLGLRTFFERALNKSELVELSKTEVAILRVLEVTIVVGGLSVYGLTAGKLFLAAVVAHRALTWYLRRQGPLVADKVALAKGALQAALLLGLLFLFFEPATAAFKGWKLSRIINYRPLHITLVIGGAALLFGSIFRYRIGLSGLLRLALFALFLQGMTFCHLGVTEAAYLNLPATVFTNALWSAVLLATAMQVTAGREYKFRLGFLVLATIGAIPPLRGLFAGTPFTACPLIDPLSRYLPVYLEPFWWWSCLLFPLATILLLLFALSEIVSGLELPKRSGAATFLPIVLVGLLAGFTTLTSRSIPTPLTLIFSLKAGKSEPGQLRPIPRLPFSSPIIKGVEGSSLDGRVIVDFKSRPDRTVMDKLLKKTRASLAGAVPSLNLYLLDVPGGGRADDVRTVLKNVEIPGLVNTVDDVFLSHCILPNDPVFSDHSLDNEWHIRSCKAEEAWKKTTGDEAVLVALVDGAVNAKHEDLRENIYKSASVFKKGEGSAQDGATSIAGVIAARGNNGIGTAGICWTLRLTPIEASRIEGRISLFSALAGLEIALGRKPRVILFPYALETKFKDYGPYFDRLAEAANNQRCLMVYPAATEQELGIKKDNQLVVAPLLPTTQNLSPEFKGTNYDLLAPGVHIWTTNKEGYGYESGSCLAAGVVAGGAALVWALEPGLSAQALCERLLRSVDEQKRVSLDKALKPKI